MRGEVDEMVFLADAPTITDVGRRTTSVSIRTARYQTVSITVYTSVFFYLTHSENIFFQHTLGTAY